MTCWAGWDGTFWLLGALASVGGYMLLRRLVDVRCVGARQWHALTMTVCSDDDVRVAPVAWHGRVALVYIDGRLWYLRLSRQPQPLHSTDPAGTRDDRLLCT